ncbi:MAG: hypothetical protein AB7O70_12560 [Hyphomicrobiales bacterium]
MENRMNGILASIRSGKGPAVVAIIVLALVVEALDAGFGLEAMASGNLAPDGFISLADVVMGITAAWLMRL